MGSPTPNPAYRISTDRLLLRCWAPADGILLRESLDASDAHLRPWIPFMRDEPRSLEATVRFVREHRAMFDRDENYRYAVFDLEGSTLLGEVMLLNRAGPGAQEIGYWMDVRHSGKGYCSEAVEALVRVGFEINQVERLEIHCSPENQASVKIAAKLGFEHEATLKERFRNPAGELGDTVIWTMFAKAYPGSPASKRSIECCDAAGKLQLS
ncbi:MAG: GNAT family N-acetyltransferase [Planctomycetota bacterium]|jgi:RimJ/RimL family protein N-acetyltransferase